MNVSVFQCPKGTEALIVAKISEAVAAVRRTRWGGALNWISQITHEIPCDTGWTRHHVPLESLSASNGIEQFDNRPGLEQPVSLDDLAFGGPLP